MLPLKQCPICGGEIKEKKVEKLLRGGNNTAIVEIKAEVCLHCGERLYSKETIGYFEQISKKLEHQEISEFEPVGNHFKL